MNKYLVSSQIMVYISVSSTLQHANWGYSPRKLGSLMIEFESIFNSFSDTECHFAFKTDSHVNMIFSPVVKHYTLQC